MEDKYGILHVKTGCYKIDFEGEPDKNTDKNTKKKHTVFYCLYTEEI